MSSSQFSKNLAALYVTCAIITLTSACTTTSSYVPLVEHESREEDCDLQIKSVSQKLNESKTTVIGNYSVREMGLTVRCDWDEVLAQNKAMACASGADGIKFTEITAPNFNSSCYQTNADFYTFNTK